MKVKKGNGLRKLSALLRKPLLTKHVRRNAQVTQDQVRMNTGQKVMFYRINKVQVFYVLAGVHPGCQDAMVTKFCTVVIIIVDPQYGTWFMSTFGCQEC